MEFNTIDMFVDFSVRNMVLDPDENSLMQASWNISFLSHEKDVYINFSSFNHYEILVKKLVSHIFHDGPFHTPCLKRVVEFGMPLFATTATTRIIQF